MPAMTLVLAWNPVSVLERLVEGDDRFGAVAEPTPRLSDRAVDRGVATSATVATSLQRSCAIRITRFLTSRSH